jgi:hypothetical protein
MFEDFQFANFSICYYDSFVSSGHILNWGESYMTNASLLPSGDNANIPIVLIPSSPRMCWSIPLVRVKESVAKLLHLLESSTLHYHLWKMHLLALRTQYIRLPSVNIYGKKHIHKLNLHFLWLNL